MNQKSRCANPNCRRLFVPDPRVKNHRYCGRKECRRLRRRRWQSEKMKTDPDYRKNQQQSHQCLRQQNHDYYQRYRAKNPQYITRNRLLQKLRDQKRRDRHNLAKMDSISFPALECTTKGATNHDGKSHPLRFVERPPPLSLKD